MIKTLSLPPPHSREQAIIMKAFVTPGLEEMFCANGTKFGKSAGAGGAMAAGFWANKGGVWRWVAPRASQAKIGLRYVSKMLPREEIKITRGGEPRIYAKNDIDNAIEFWSGKFPEDMEGEGVKGYCLDEASKLNEQVYASAKTTVTYTGGPILAFSTPRGKNWFFEKCMEAKEHMNWSLKKGIPPKKIFITAPTAANPGVKREIIERAKLNLNDRLFRQYYLAEFVSDSEIFAGMEACLADAELIELEGQIEFWLHPGAAAADVVIGVDWAKKSDYTVFMAIDYSSPHPRVVGVQRFQGLKYTQAVKELYKFTRKFNKVGVIYHDKTGVGEAVDDLLSVTDLPAEGIIFTNDSKCAMVNSLILTIEKGEIELCNWDTLKEEMGSYEVQVSAVGKMRYGHPRGMHDDTVSALMLAHAALQEFGGGCDIMYLDELKNLKLQSDNWQSDLLDKLEDEEDGGFYDRIRRAEAIWWEKYGKHAA